MAISQKKYVDITSGVGGEATAARRELIARLFTSNAALTNGQILETDLAGTLALFGSTSAEYTYALKYFGFISKNISKANKISFAQWPQVATAPTITSSITLPAYTEFAALTDTGSVKVDLGGETHDVDPDFTGDASLADVASSMEDAVQAITAGGTMWTSATFTYSGGKFILTGGVDGADDIGYFTAPASGTDLKAMFGMDAGSNPVLNLGADIETPVEALTRVDETNDNFGSFSFVNTMTAEEIGLVAAWVKAGNYKYLYSVSASTANVQSLAAALDGETGTILSADANAAQAEFMPMVLLATTDYDRVNSVKSFMYQKFDDEDPSVTTDALAATYDAAHINYLGTTQQAGKLIQFYQDGYMMDGGDVGPYCNEIWLKDAISTEFMNLLLALEMIPANDTGSAIAATAIQSIIAEALKNGTIQPGKTLTNVQKAYITQVSGNVDAWRDVQSVGYWLDVVITSEVVGSVTKYIATYTLIYSKGDSVRKVEGFDILI
jgi:hypothetical protein